MDILHEGIYSDVFDDKFHWTFVLHGQPSEWGIYESNNFGFEPFSHIEEVHP